MKAFTIVPEAGKKEQDDRYNLDKHYYELGKESAEQELSRDEVVESIKFKRDRDCFNMGYSYGERA